MTTVDKKLKNKKERALQRKNEEEARLFECQSTSSARQILYTKYETEEDLSGSDSDVEFEPISHKTKGKIRK